MAAAGGPLIPVGNVLVVTARPGQESAALGGLLYAFRRSGACLGLLCLTRGEASPLNSTWNARLEAVRPWELQLAASVLGISSVAVASYPDGRLRCSPRAELTERVRRAIRQHGADLLVVIDPEAGDPDDAAVATAACTAARQDGVPVVACTGPDGRGAWAIELGAETATARVIQKAAVAEHASQSCGLPEQTRRIDLLDGREHLRWLVSPLRTPEHDRAGRPTGWRTSPSVSAAHRAGRYLRRDHQCRSMPNADVAISVTDDGMPGRCCTGVAR
jgi:N-acetylglucosamine malate deacetylase 2